MDINVRRRRHHVVVENSLSDLYSQDVTMYSDYPQAEIRLWEFEGLALERLQLLRIIEQASLKGHKIYSESWKACIKEDLFKNNLKKFVRLMSGFGGQTEADIQARRADHISHFILLLAYCRSEDLRRWFLARELEWFKLRFIAQSSQQVKKFLEVNKFEYYPISQDEKEQLKEELVMATHGMSAVAYESSDFYKVPFTDVLPLVKNRSVFLQKGFAYIPLQDLVVCFQSKLRASLSEKLNMANHRLPLYDDERVTSLLTELHNAYTGKDYNFQAENKDAVNPANLDEYSKKHYPLCMRNVHQVLRSNHHLKHHARLQYGLFIKGIGVLYEDALEFWRQEFTKTMDSNKFDKEHVYNIKHTYGMVGNMTNYSPYSCVKIITSSVGVGEHHGCPFKHWDASILKSKITEHGVSSEGVHTIMDLVTNGHYQVACTKYFECIHGQPPSLTINHPNQYFEESMNLAKQKLNKKN